MDFALMPEKTARVGEAVDFLAPALFANVGTIVFVHVFSKEENGKLVKVRK